MSAPKIFISYRRADSADAAGRIFDRLVDAFGDEQVFKDVDSISPGADFSDVIAEQLSACQAVVVVIGRFWLTVQTPQGTSRLHEPSDLVRIEVEQALRRSLLVIPALVGSASMPTEDQLPESIRQLARRHAVSIRQDPDFHRDMDRLIRALGEHFEQRKVSIPAKVTRIDQNISQTKKPSMRLRWWMLYCAFFIALAVTIKTITYFPSKHGPSNSVDLQVLKFDPASAQALKRTDAEGALEIVRREDRWVITKPVEEAADDKELETLWKTFGNLRALRVAALSPADVKLYGLDAPLAIVTLDLSPDQKPNQVVLKIGKAVAEATGEHFAQVVGHPAVVVLPASLIRILRAAPLAFRDRVLTKLPGFDTLRLERDRRKATFALGKDSWMLTEPLRAEANTTLLDDFLTALSSLHADELVQDKPTADDVKKYGLDSPHVRYQVLEKGKELLDFQVGGVEKNGTRRYARIGKRDLVFLLDAKLSAMVLEEFRPRTVWDMPLDAAEVNQVRFSWTKNPFTLSRVRSNWQVSDKPKTLVNAKAVDDMLGVLAALKLERYVIDKDADLQLFGLKTPELTLIAKTNTGQWGLRIGARVGESKARYAQLDQPGKTDVFLLAEADASRIVKALDAFVEK